MNGRNNQQHQLQTLVLERKIHLARKLRHYTSAQQSAGNTASSALTKLLQKEVSSGLSAVFGGSPKQSATSGNSGSASAPTSGPAAGGGLSAGQMETTIDRMVASSLVNGRQTSTVLRSLFGLVPSLIGR